MPSSKKKKKSQRARDVENISRCPDFENEAAALKESNAKLVSFLTKNPKWRWRRVARLAQRVGQVAVELLKLYHKVKAEGKNPLSRCSCGKMCCHIFEALLRGDPTYDEFAAALPVQHMTNRVKHDLVGYYCVVANTADRHGKLPTDNDKDELLWSDKHWKQAVKIAESHVRPVGALSDNGRSGQFREIQERVKDAMERTKTTGETVTVEFDASTSPSAKSTTKKSSSSTDSSWAAFCDKNTSMSPSQLLGQALSRMPVDHPDRTTVSELYDSVAKANAKALSKDLEDNATHKEAEARRAITEWETKKKELAEAEAESDAADVAAVCERRHGSQCESVFSKQAYVIFYFTSPLLKFSAYSTKYHMIKQHYQKPGFASGNVITDFKLEWLVDSFESYRHTSLKEFAATITIGIGKRKLSDSNIVKVRRFFGCKELGTSFEGLNGQILSYIVDIETTYEAMVISTAVMPNGTGKPVRVDEILKPAVITSEWGQTFLNLLSQVAKSMFETRILDAEEPLHQGSCALRRLFGYLMEQSATIASEIHQRAVKEAKRRNLSKTYTRKLDVFSSNNIQSLKLWCFVHIFKYHVWAAYVQPEAIVEEAAMLAQARHQALQQWSNKLKAILPALLPKGDFQQRYEAAILSRFNLKIVEPDVEIMLRLRVTTDMMALHKAAMTSATLHVTREGYLNVSLVKLRGRDPVAMYRLINHSMLATADATDAVTPDQVKLKHQEVFEAIDDVCKRTHLRNRLSFATEFKHLAPDCAPWLPRDAAQRYTKVFTMQEEHVTLEHIKEHFDWEVALRDLFLEWMPSNLAELVDNLVDYHLQQLVEERRTSGK